MSSACRRVSRARARRVGAASLLVGLLHLVGVACGTLSPPSSNAPAKQASPTELPAPAPLSSPPAALSTPIPPPEARPSPAAAAPTRALPAAAPPAPSAARGPERVRVGNSDGQGANLRAEPGASGARLKTIRDGAELEVIGQDRQVEGRTWRNVRDPSDGASGWVVAELLVAASPAQAAAPTGTAPRAGSPAPSPVAGAAATQGQRLADADRAYVTALRPEIDDLGKAITAVSTQMEAAGGRPRTVDDPAWRSSIEAGAVALTAAARRIRSTRPGPGTGEVHDHALKAADWADEAARMVMEMLDSRDARRIGPTRTTLLRVVSEINAMNAVLIRLQ